MYHSMINSVKIYTRVFRFKEKTVANNNDAHKGGVKSILILNNF